MEKLDLFFLGGGYGPRCPHGYLVAMRQFIVWESASEER